MGDVYDATSYHTRCGSKADKMLCVTFCVTFLLPVVFELLSGPEKLLDVLGHLLGLQYDVLCAGQGGVRLPRIPASSLLRLPTTFLLAAAAHTDRRKHINTL